MTRPHDEEPPAEEPALDPVLRDLEAPPVDAAEQATPVAPTEAPEEVRPGPEVSEWDALEQTIVIDMEDEYR